MSTTFRALRVEKDGDRFSRSVQELPESTLPAHPVEVEVAYSSLNYKDALSATGNPGVTKSYPHTPGIDAAGRVVASEDGRFREGDEVIVTSYDLGMNTPGGFGERIRVPAEWVVPLPPGLSLREAMVLGTAGLTAGLCVDALLEGGLKPDGPVVVTGASGGVGSVAVALLAHLGFETWASTGTEAAHEWLGQLGASKVIARPELSEVSERPLLKSRFAGAVDTVGGDTLANLVKSLSYRGSVAACGLVGGAELPLTVFPFILRGVSLLGIDSAECPMELRQRVWQRFAGAWKLELSAITEAVSLEGLDTKINAILAGETEGRVLVEVAG